MNIDETQKPTIGVGVVVLKDDCVLLIRRGRPPRKGIWTIPGGRQKWGETVRETAMREIAEETGLSIRLEALVDVIDLVEHGATGHVGMHYTLIDFWARPLSDGLCAGDDAAEARWVALDRLDDYDLWEPTRAVITRASDLAAAGEPV